MILVHRIYKYFYSRYFDCNKRNIKKRIGTLINWTVPIQVVEAYGITFIGFCINNMQFEFTTDTTLAPLDAITKQVQVSHHQGLMDM